ncbi:54S ribosomal protein L2 mitochondrial, partial [Ascosphaera atra]
MLQPRLQGPWKALDTLLSRKSFLPAQRSISTLSQLFSNPRRPQASGNGLASSSTILSRTARVFAPGVAQVRHAGHNAQGRANAGTKNGPGKRLGAKKASGQYVVPGNIIFRQRGTVWYPGENCGVGRDHSIFALEKGYVKYYKDPARHPDKKYIGVALARDDVLPYPKNAPSKRRLGMLPFPRVEEPKEQVKPGATSFEPTMHAGYVF